jgi:hypothetical protein
MGDVTTRPQPMPRQRDQVRDFPGRRALNLTLRTAHLAGVVLLGAALLGGNSLQMGIWLTLASGAGMFAGDLWANPAHVREVAGSGVLLKLVLVAAMAVRPEWAFAIFWFILVLSALLSHAPGALRHRRLF